MGSRRNVCEASPAPFEGGDGFGTSPHAATHLDELCGIDGLMPHSSCLRPVLDQW